MTPLDILHLALAEPIGIIVRVERPEAARQALYQARTKAGPGFEGLQIRISPFPEGDLVVCHQIVAVQSEEGKK
jgi:hypothetical protein